MLEFRKNLEELFQEANKLSRKVNLVLNPVICDFKYWGENIGENTYADVGLSPRITSPNRLLDPQHARKIGPAVFVDSWPSLAISPRDRLRGNNQLRIRRPVRESTHPILLQESLER